MFWRGLMADQVISGSDSGPKLVTDQTIAEAVHDGEI